MNENDCGVWTKWKSALRKTKKKNSKRKIEIKLCVWANSTKGVEVTNVGIVRARKREEEKEKWKQHQSRPSRTNKSHLLSTISLITVPFFMPVYLCNFSFRPENLWTQNFCHSVISRHKHIKRSCTSKKKAHFKRVAVPIAKNHLPHAEK